ncbi:MAG: hypothetical protein LBJ63_00050 [Prevotellaceae bacterium]|jgi:hypothetical protein|nr:hypothetical protein [Prevotellaceae bacterium]
MRQLELKDISGYLPYDLYVITNRTINPKLVHCAGRGNLYIGTTFRAINIKYCKAVMRPLSDMYKTIIHNEIEIIPIVELAKIAFPNQLNYCHLKGNYCDIFSSDKKYSYLFRYEEKESYFRLVYTGDFNDMYTNQHQLFDYLKKLKIDYRGLIESGLAIDANTLETNPYK